MDLDQSKDAPLVRTNTLAEFLALLRARDTRGCCRRDTLVATDRGLLRLDELGDVNGDQWQGVEGVAARTLAGEHPVTKFYVNGFVETRKITTADGVELEASLNHRFQVMHGDGTFDWKAVADLAIGDKLVTRLGLQPEGLVPSLKATPQSAHAWTMRQPPTLTVDIAYFFGLFYANGSVHEKGIRIAFNRKQPTVVKWLADFTAREFRLSHTFDESGDDSGSSFCVNSRNLLDWLKVNGVSKDYAEAIEVPRVIRCAGKSAATAFIDGYWRLDGGVHNAGNSWSLCSVSETFARQLQQLCRAVGLNVSLRNAGPGGFGARDRWILLNRNVEPGKERYLSKEFRDRDLGDIWLDPVAAIVPSRCATFDIEVDEVHHYVANGTVSHNTLSACSRACRRASTRSSPRTTSGGSPSPPTTRSSTWRATTGSPSSRS